MSKMKYPFNPQLGPEYIVMQQEPQTGAVYFTTDTRKIYLDVDGSRSKLPMGGNIGLFYGNMQLSAPPADGQEEFEFSITDIVGNESGVNMLYPNDDDLILNSDGCFYKVLSRYGEDTETVLNTKKLTIAGSGGGGGNNSSNDPNSLSGMAVSKLRADLGATVLYSSPCPISFAVKVTDDLGDPQSGMVGTYDLYIDNVKKASGTVKGCTLNIANSEMGKLDLNQVLAEELNTIDVGPYLPLKQNINVKISVTSMDGYQSTRTVNISTTDMTLKWDYDETTLNYYDATNQDMELSWSVSGNVEKTTYIIVNDDIEHPIILPPTTRTEQTYRLNFKEYNLTHGSHKIEMYAVTSIGTGTKTPSVFKNIFVVENSLTTIVSVGLFTKELTQYNTIKIPILVYDPNGGPSTVTLRETPPGSSEDIIKDTWENVANLDRSRFWSYTPTTSGTTMLTVQCNGTDKSFAVNVNDLGIDIEEVSGYAFKFKANEFASNSNVLNWNSNGYSADFSPNFDWINGGLKSETEGDNHRQFMNIKAGSSMTINYPLFETTARTNGKVFKMIFKATNCRDYDAQILSCKRDKKVAYVHDIEQYLRIENGTSLLHTKKLEVNQETGVITLVDATSDSYDLTNKDSRELFNDSYISYQGKLYQCKIKKVENSETLFYAEFYEVTKKDTFEGILLNAQNATYNSRNQTISTQYCEDRYIELELDISKQDPNGIKNYITFWIDGVPSGYVVYDSSDNFIDNDKNFITIGSNDCDIQLYTLKVYEKSLSDNQHLQNFIADAPSASEMIARYNRNNILDERNEISPALLAKANPDCLVHVYEIDRMTKTKKDKVTGCTYAQYQGSDQAQLTADNVTIKVQGTSSEKYVVAAANLDSEFKNGFVDANGNVLEGWSMSANSIPVDFTCTKVNVASCENANNALNQEWYNMFQPYQTVLRCKNPKARDTMEFTNGVLFIQDNNSTFTTSGNYDPKDNNIFGDTTGYLSNPYPKMYSLANMGNSKKNTHVLHDEENPLEFCVEVGDNQEPQQWMVDDTYSDSDIDDGKEYYGFRYPDGVENATQEMKDQWRNFVSWMAQSNPQPMYKEHKAQNEDEFLSFAYIPKTNTYLDIYVLNEEQNRYDKIDHFDPSINTYYTKTANKYGYTNLRLDEPKSFEPYTFRGYKANAEIQKNYNPLIAGCKVTEFATKKTIYDYQKDENGHYIYDENNQLIPIEGSQRVEDVPYTTDCYEYRMAKMLSECEDHLCMDSVIYHFLFIERHCMIDNVAKNTFWSTEDGRVWNLTKDYDNDTADGNDNNGKFTRTYGMEPMDKLNVNTYVFNAHQSVWFNFINGLKEACEHMYHQLENLTVTYKNRKLKLWSKDDYIWFFDEWQSKIPERCWIEDYYRKYHRPYELYNDTMFNSMMEGGQKKHQRAQYETYQDIYMSSKYFGTTCSGSYSIIRGNGTNLLNHELPITTYCDCYIHAHVGSAKSTKRVKRNEIEKLICPANDINNATVYFYPINVFSTIGETEGSGQIGAYEPEQISFSGANKLRELVVSTTNTNINESLKTGFSVANNKLLEKLYAANLTGYTSHLDLTGCPNLREVDASNSTFTAVLLPDNAPMEKIKLYKPTSLTFSNLRNVTDFSIADHNILSSLNLNNVDDSPAINSKLLVENSTALENYKLTKVKWLINNASEIDGDKIKILESLLTKHPIETDKGPELQENSLVGTLDITASGYNASSAGALAIYESYAKSTEVYEIVRYADEEAFNKDTRKKFVLIDGVYTETEEFVTTNTYYIEKLVAEYPNLDINFLGDKAVLYTVNIYDGDGNIFWSRKAAPGNTITEEFLKYGPKGSFKSASLYKSKTAKFEYKFLNHWTVKDDAGTKISEISQAEPTGVVINKNIHLYPSFEVKVRSYTVEVKSKHPATGVITTLASGTYPYDTPLNQTYPKDTVPYADSSNLPLLHMYNFKGYSLIEGGTTPISDTYPVNGETTLWAIFELVENARTISHPEWFKYEPYTYREPGADVTGATGLIISPKYSNLKGKITIPSYVDYKGEEKPIIAIKGFGGSDIVASTQEITHIFMEERADNKPNRLYRIDEDCFTNSPHLVYFDFEKCAVRTIASAAFRNSNNLQYTGSLGDYLYYVGSYAFNNSLRTTQEVILKIPSSVKTVQTYGFGILAIHSGSSLEIGSKENPSQLWFSDADNLFTLNANNKYVSVTIYTKLGQSEELISSKLADSTTADITFGTF